LVVALGSDPRLTGPLLRAAIVTGLQSEGVEVRDAGLCTTPAMFYSLVAPGEWVVCRLM
jgi:phosphomannomutase